MNDPKELIIEKLKWILGEMGVSDIYPEVSLVSEPQFGDFSSNVAMKCWNQEARSMNHGIENPREFADKIVETLIHDSEFMINFVNIEVAGPGFINFFLSSKYLQNTLNEIVQKETEYGKTNTKVEPVSTDPSSVDGAEAEASGGGQKIIVEFGDPNPFKEIHIGHLRNFCIGESFAKLLEFQGKNVTRANYQGDVGLHVAKAIWGLLKHEEEFLDSAKSEEEKVVILASSYVEGAKAYEEDENAKQEIQNLNKRIYEDASDLHQLWEEGRKVSLEHFEELYKRIGVHYDKYYFESQTAKRGKEIVLAHIDNGVFERDAGAVVYRGEKDGFHTRVFLTSQEYATYEAKDLALAVIKNEVDSYDESIILTANEQLEYFQVMLAALKKIEPDLASKTKHLTFGFVKLKEGKMSSRTGDVITAQWLLDEAVNRVQNTFPEMDTATAEKVGVGAVKYSMLKFSVPADIRFSFEESINLEGNSGPYLQYSYVRTRSVLEKFENLNSKSETNSNVQNPNLEKEEEELLRFLVHFSYVIEQAAEEFSPNLLCNYLFDLAQKFNLFYQKHKIIGSENEEFRLQLTQAVGQVLKNGLKILGIEIVEKM